MRVMGVDVGSGGALVLMEDEVPIEWMLMPTMKIGSATRVNAAMVSEFIEASHPYHIYVELVGAMPGQGVSSMFNFGHSCGTIMGVIGAWGIPHTMVSPQVWKKRAGLIGKDKDASRARAIQLWPAWRDLDKKGNGQALADAALIARYGHG
jgi:crossover junction endodeoxyribonuclease RuvC